MSQANGSAAIAPGGGAQIRGTATQQRSVALTAEFARARVETVTAMRELQRAIISGDGLVSLSTASERASLATGRLTGFARLLAATLQNLT